MIATNVFFILFLVRYVTPSVKKYNELYFIVFEGWKVLKVAS